MKSLDPIRVEWTKNHPSSLLPEASTLPVPRPPGTRLEKQVRPNLRQKEHAPVLKRKKDSPNTQVLSDFEKDLLENYASNTYKDYAPPQKKKFMEVY